MASLSVARLFVGAFVICCLASSVLGAAITVTFTGTNNYGGSATGTCPYTMTAGNDYTFNSNSATINCAISGTATSVTFGSGGSVNTYVNTLGFSQTGGTFSVSNGQSVTHQSISYTGSSTVTIAGTLIGQSASFTSNSITVSSTGSVQTTAGNLLFSPVANGNPLSISGTVSAAGAGAGVGIGNFVTTTAAMTSQISAAGGNVVISPWGTSTLAGPISSAGGNIAIGANTGANLALTISGTIVNTNSGGSVALGGPSDVTSLTVSGAIGLNNGAFSANTAGGTATFQSAISGASNVNLPTTGTVTIASTASFGFLGNFVVATTGAFTNAGFIAGNSSSTIDINPSGAATIGGVIQCLNPTVGSNVFRIRPTGTTVSIASATINTAGEVIIGNSGATTYPLSSSTINFSNRFILANPTTFAASTFITPNWNVQVSGGAAVAGPSGTALPYTFLASSNAITSTLFPSGINTNCIWVQAPVATTSFAVSLPNAIQYRNYVQASPSALTVTSTTGGAVTRCAPLLTSVLDRRNDIFKANLVYFGGNAVFYFVTNQALPFGTITASDFTISGGTITSVTSLGGSPAAFAIAVSLTCDGVVSLSYNGSVTGNGGNFLGISASSADRVVNAKCIANIYAPCG